jgi:D-alanine-D-alanine ligase
LGKAEKKLRVGVIFGGQSGEHEVSLTSAKGIMNAMDPAKYDIVPIGISKSGQWLGGSEAHQRLVDAAAGHPALKNLPGSQPNSPEIAWLAPVRGGQMDVIFPCC